MKEFPVKVVIILVLLSVTRESIINETNYKNYEHNGFYNRYRIRARISEMYLVLFYLRINLFAEN
jgi:hypothetical protein